MLPEGKRLYVAFLILLLMGFVPVVFMLLGGAGRLERWSLAHPASGVAEWTARKLIFFYVVTLQPDKTVQMYEGYLNTFHAKAPAHKPQKYRKVFWNYAWAAAEYYPKGPAGQGFYFYAQEFPDDVYTEEALFQAQHYGYRPEE